MASPLKLGIDFGTTHTVVAYADRGNYPVVSFFDEGGDAHDFYPSAVAERAGELRFGFEALAVADDPSFQLLRSFKRMLSSARITPSSPVIIGSTKTTIGELLTRFLQALKAALETRSNLSEAFDKSEIRSVAAAPANAFGAQRFITLDAFRRAGFAPAAMLNEPSAAGFEYTHRHRDTLSSRRDHVVVYDLGGGTFDASLLRMRARSHEVLATAGINELGGDDFDGALLDLILAKAILDRRKLAPRVLERLIDQCRDAKERLNPNSRKITIDLEHAFEEKGRGEAVVLVSEFYEACAPLVDRSIEAMAPLMKRLPADGNEPSTIDGSAIAPIEAIVPRASESKEASLPDDIAGIYVVGGASELPIVARALRARFGRRVHRSPYPSAAIAIGLAIACDDSAAFELSDRYTRAFGVFREGSGGREITFDPIFAPGTLLPSPKDGPLRIRRDYRAAHNVGHFRFFECASVGDDGRPLGDITLSGDVLFPFDGHLGKTQDLGEVPITRIGHGPRIEEEYALDSDGIVAITIKNLDEGYQRAYRLIGN